MSDLKNLQDRLNIISAEWTNVVLRESKLLDEIEKLRAVAEAVKAMRNEAMKYENWYTFVTCEFAEDVDDALKALEEK